MALLPRLPKLFKKGPVKQEEGLFTPFTPGREIFPKEKVGINFGSFFGDIFGKGVVEKVKKFVPPKFVTKETPIIKKGRELGEEIRTGVAEDFGLPERGLNFGKLFVAEPFSPAKIEKYTPIDAAKDLANLALNWTINPITNIALTGQEFVTGERVGVGVGFGIKDTKAKIPGSEAVPIGSYPSFYNEFKKQGDSKTVAGLKTGVLMTFDSLFAYGTARLGLPAVKIAIRQLPESLLFKFQKQSIPVDEVIGSMVGSGGSKQADAFISSLTVAERKALFKVARAYEDSGIPVQTFKREPTELGKFARLEPTEGIVEVRPERQLPGFRRAPGEPEFAPGLRVERVERVGGPEAELQKVLRESKGLSADDIIKKNPDINLKRDVVIKDVHGVKKVIPEGEALTPYELKGNKVLLQDGETYIVSKNQFKNIKGQSVTAEAKEFAPELVQTEEVVKGAKEGFKVTGDKGQELSKFATREEAQVFADKQTGLRDIIPVEPSTKFSPYQLTGGENYTEILIQAPIGKEKLPTGITEKDGVFFDSTGAKVERKEFEKFAPDQADFDSPHWKEPNVLAHIRLNERTFKDGKVTFIEEIQSDWAREVRKPPARDKEDEAFVAIGDLSSKDNRYVVWQNEEPQSVFSTKEEAEKRVEELNKKLPIRKIPSNPLLKKWQELTIKRGLQEAVDNGSAYLAWTTGEQQAARYDLSQEAESILLITQKDGTQRIVASGKTGNRVIDKAIEDESELEGIIGKELARRIREAEEKTLSNGTKERLISGEELKVGGQWAINLYDKQIKNIVEDLTGKKVEIIDMGLGVEGGRVDFQIVETGRLLTTETIKVGEEAINGENSIPYIITHDLGGGKFKAIQTQVLRELSEKNQRSIDDQLKKIGPHNTLTEDFNISIEKSVGQQAIKITPEVKAIVSGEAPELKKPSGVSPIKPPTIEPTILKVEKFTFGNIKAAIEKSNRRPQKGDIIEDPEGNRAIVEGVRDSLTGAVNVPEGTMEVSVKRAGGEGLLRSIPDVKQIFPETKEPTDADIREILERKRPPAPVEVKPLIKPITETFSIKADIEVLGEVIRDHPARPLTKFANKNQEIPEVLGEKGGKFKQFGDEIAESLGFPDSETARESYRELVGLRERKADLIKELREKETPIIPKLLPTKATKLKGFDNFISKDSSIGKLRHEINLINGSRLQGKITAEQANKSIQAIREKILELAEQLGAATVVRSGKVFPAIRRSGFYAKKEAETAIIKNVYNQTLPPHLMALKQDAHVRGGPFGVVFTEVWKPTEKAIRGEKEFVTEQTKLVRDVLKKHDVKINPKTGERYSDVLERFVTPTSKEKVVRTELRKIFDDLRDQANEVRISTGRQKIAFRDNYVPHAQKAAIWSEIIANEGTIADNLDFIVPNQVTNPFAFKRVLEEMFGAERNLFTLLDRYIAAIAKDIYITPAIENIKAYNGVIRNRELFKASKYWDEYIRTGLIGKQHKLDTALSIGLKTRKVLQKWNNMVNLAFLTGKVAWNVATQPLSYIMNVPMEAGVLNSVKAIFKSFSKPLRQYVKENSNVLSIKSSDVRAMATGEGRNIQNRIYRTKINKYNDFISMLSSIEERELTLASYVAGLERAKDLGLKGDEALWFADLTAARTQSMYNKENRALILNSDIARTVFPFQSFAVEMFNHAKEILTKTKGAERLNARQRLGKLFGLLIGIYLSGLYAKTITGRKKTTVGTFIPFLGAYVDMMIARAMGESYYGGRNPITVFQIGEEVIKGAKDYIEHGSLKRLRKVAINFGLALFGIGGGGQINNIIDGTMSIIDEDVKNIEGDVMFKTESALDKVVAPIFGPWATEEGRDYWDPKPEDEDKRIITLPTLPTPALPALPKLPKVSIPKL